MRLYSTLAVLLAVCGCVTRDERPPSKLAEGCLLNSDCEAPLVCAFRRCHVQCDTSRDCEPGFECVPADPRPVNVCVLPDERSCRGQPCPPTLVCGPDLTCRSPCEGPGASESCLREQLCVDGNVCASPSFLVDGGLPRAVAMVDAGAPFRCEYNTDCPQPLVCNRASGQCQRECRSSRDCAVGTTCAADAGICVVPVPVVNGAPVAVPPTWGSLCVFDPDCWAGLTPTDAGVPSTDPRILICGATSRCTFECVDGRSCPSRRCESFRCAEPMNTGGGAGGGSAGGAAGGAAGGSIAGGSAGGSAGGGVAGGIAGGTTGGGTAGGTTGGGSAGGTTGGGTAGGATGGGTAGGATGGGSAGGTTGGGSAGGAGGGSAADAGIPPAPVALVGASQVVSPGAQVTLSGLGSTGVFPLTYRWTQIAGPAVALSANNSLTAYTPRFTAPSTQGTVLRFELRVEDALLRTSAPATSEVLVSAVPVAAFTPDGGLYFSQQHIQLVSTSYDDGGLALADFSWRLLPGSPGTLSADGGPLATLSFPSIALGAPDQLVVVGLTVTNAIGVRSPEATRSYTARGSNGDNWTLSASAPGNVLVNSLTPAPVSLSATVTTSSPSPQFSTQWSCSSGVAVVNPSALSASYLPPVPQGANLVVTCTVTVDAQPPLVPAQRTAQVSTVLQDGVAPSLVSTSIQGGTASVFGFLATFSEPIAGDSSVRQGSNHCTPSGNRPYTQSLGRTMLLAPSTLFPLGGSCTSWTLDVCDRAPVPNCAAITNATPTFVPRLAWQGPYESTASFADPRPLFVSLGQLPFEQLAAWAQPTPSTPPFELIGRDDSQLVRFSFDPLTAPMSCSPSCAIASTTVSIPGLGGPAAAFENDRALWSTDRLFASFEFADGGVASVKRDSDGGWSASTGTGRFFMRAGQLAQARVTPGGFVVEAYDPGTDTFTVPEVVTTNVADVRAFIPGWVEQSRNVTNPSRRSIVLIKRSTGAWEPWEKRLGTGGLFGPWQLFTTNVPASVLNVRMTDVAITQSPDPWVAVESPSSPFISGRELSNLGSYPLAAQQPSSVDMVGRGRAIVIAAVEAGDLRLFVRSEDGSAIQLPGPPRSALPSPPPILDFDVACEAAWPRLGFVQDALVVTWQERCAVGPWKVYARVLR